MPLSPTSLPWGEGPESIFPLLLPPPRGLSCIQKACFCWKRCLDPPNPPLVKGGTGLIAPLTKGDLGGRVFLSEMCIHSSPEGEGGWGEGIELTFF